jgi:hypothetical protein
MDQRSSTSPQEVRPKPIRYAVVVSERMLRAVERVPAEVRARLGVKVCVLPVHGDPWQT